MAETSVFQSLSHIGKSRFFSQSIDLNLIEFRNIFAPTRGLSTFCLSQMCFSLFLPSHSPKLLLINIPDLPPQKQLVVLNAPAGHPYIE